MYRMIELTLREISVVSGGDGRFEELGKNAGVWLGGLFGLHHWERYLEGGGRVPVFAIVPLGIMNLRFELPFANNFAIATAVMVGGSMGLFALVGSGIGWCIDRSIEYIGSLNNSPGYVKLLAFISVK